METECCPKFSPKPWDKKILIWKNKKFVKGRVFTIFYIPLNFGGVVKRIMKKMDAAGATCPDWLALSYHTSKWNMDLYVATDKKVPKVKNTTISGKFLSKVYEGPYQKTDEWCKDFDRYVKKEGLKRGKMYMWYTTCPACAKKYGKNYVVIISEVK